MVFHVLGLKTGYTPDFSGLLGCPPPSQRAHRTADTLFKRLRGARLDGTYEDEMRKLHRVELLIIDDLALHRLETTETSDFYELIVERHRKASTITSNREPP